MLIVTPASGCFLKCLLSVVEVFVDKSYSCPSLVGGELAVDTGVEIKRAYARTSLGRSPTRTYEG